MKYVGVMVVVMVAVVTVAAVVAAVSLTPLYTKSHSSLISRRFRGNAESSTRENRCHKILKQSVKTSIFFNKKLQIVHLYIHIFKANNYEYVITFSIPVPMIQFQKL
jgi:hypothetical protein